MTYREPVGMLGNPDVLSLSRLVVGAGRVCICCLEWSYEGTGGGDIGCWGFMSSIVDLGMGVVIRKEQVNIGKW